MRGPSASELKHERAARIRFNDMIKRKQKAAEHVASFLSIPMGFFFSFFITIPWSYYNLSAFSP
jgi:hypothetical protein